MKLEDYEGKMVTITYTHQSFRHGKLMNVGLHGIILNTEVTKLGEKLMENVFIPYWNVFEIYLDES